MKAYTVTEDQLENLGLLQLASTVSFSVSASLATFWVGVRQEIAFSGKDVTAAAQSWWDGISTAALAAAIILAFLGIALAIRGKTTIGKIKRDTIHD